MDVLLLLSAAARSDENICEHTLAHFPLGSFIFELTQALLVPSVRKRERELERKKLQLSEGVKDSLKGNAEQVTPAAELHSNPGFISPSLPSIFHLQLTPTVTVHTHTHTHTPPCVCLSPPQGSVCELMAVSLCRCDGKQLLRFSPRSHFFSPPPPGPPFLIPGNNRVMGLRPLFFQVSLCPDILWLIIHR